MSVIMIYKIFRPKEWEELESAGHTAGAPIDLADGFIHFSTYEQAAETAKKHFSGGSDLWLAAVDETTMGDALKWEPSRGGALFPHLYAPLQLDQVIWCKSLPLGLDGHIFPSEML